MFTTSAVLKPDTVYLALYKAEGNWINGFIRMMEKSPYSHSELLLNGEGHTSSLRDGGVRVKAMPFPADSWDLLELPWADPKAVHQWFVDNDQIGYGLGDLLMKKFLRFPVDPPGKFCHDAVADALGFAETNDITANRLLELCQLKNEAYKNHGTAGTNAG